MPTVASEVDMVGIARACGYPNAVSVDNYEELDNELKEAKKSSELSFIEVKCTLGARDDLGRPTTSALDNKREFMDYLRQM
jgi:phosphonopyruvate decarboxylase